MINGVSDRLAARLPFFYGYVMIPVTMFVQIATSPGQTFTISAFTPSLRESLGYALNGIICHGDDGGRGGPALIILNSGLMHRVGTCRTSVVLARKAADLGILSLRFDHSGIGDSSPRQVLASDEERMLEEINAAQDFVQATYGISQFVLYGLCSGAQYSFKHAQTDNRVIGLVGIDSGLVDHTVHHGSQERRWMKTTQVALDLLATGDGRSLSFDNDGFDHGRISCSSDVMSSLAVHGSRRFQRETRDPFGSRRAPGRLARNWTRHRKGEFGYAKFPGFPQPSGARVRRRQRNRAVRTRAVGPRQVCSANNW